MEDHVLGDQEPEAPRESRLVHRDRRILRHVVARVATDEHREVERPLTM